MIRPVASTATTCVSPSEGPPYRAPSVASVGWLFLKRSSSARPPVRMIPWRRSMRLFERALIGGSALAVVALGLEAAPTSAKPGPVVPALRGFGGAVLVGDGEV